MNQFEKELKKTLAFALKQACAKRFTSAVKTLKLAVAEIEHEMSPDEPERILPHVHKRIVDAELSYRDDHDDDTHTSPIWEIRTRDVLAFDQGGIRIDMHAGQQPDQIIVDGLSIEAARDAITDVIEEQIAPHSDEVVLRVEMSPGKVLVIHFEDGEPISGRIQFDDTEGGAIENNAP